MGKGLRKKILRFEVGGLLQNYQDFGRSEKDRFLDRFWKGFWRGFGEVFGQVLERFLEIILISLSYFFAYHVGKDLGRDLEGIWTDFEIIFDRCLNDFKPMSRTWQPLYFAVFYVLSALPMHNLPQRYVRSQIVPEHKLNAK